MELYELESFVSVVENGSFTHAAEALCVTQPAVTRQMASLERRLKTRLFERLGRSVKLTSAGEALHRYAEQILRLAREAERAVGDVATGVSGKLAVGASSTTATYVLPRLLHSFRESYAGVELSVHTGSSAQVTDLVIRGAVDVGIVTGFREQTGLVEIPLSEYATSVVVYPDHPLAIARSAESDGTQKVVSAEELIGIPLILMEEGANLRTYVDRLFASASIEKRVTMELDNVEAIKKMIEARLGISLLPLVSVEVEVAAGRLVTLPLMEEPNEHRSIVAIHRRDKYLSVILAAFIQLLQSIE